MVLLGVLAVTPATAEEWPESITEARKAAVDFALTMDIVTGALASTCARAGEDLAPRAEAARGAWVVANGQLVDSAHKYLLFIKAAVAQQKGEEAGDAFYEGQRTRLFADAQKALTDTFPEGGIAADECEAVIERLGSGAMNLEAKPAFFSALMEIDDAISRIRER
jgi:hypothetical protein|nr:hypothetical protein [Panacagrimonas sp.]